MSLTEAAALRGDWGALSPALLSPSQISPFLYSRRKREWNGRRTMERRVYSKRLRLSLPLLHTSSSDSGSPLPFQTQTVGGGGAKGWSSPPLLLEGSGLTPMAMSLSVGSCPDLTPAFKLCLKTK